MTVKLANETDAFEDVIPVEVLVSPETVAAYGEAADTKAIEKLTLPKDVVPGFGGLHVEMSSTAMVGLGEGARYLVEYPYGCAEQRALARARDAAGGRSGRCVLAAWDRHGKDSSGRAADAEGARAAISVQIGGFAVLAGRVPFDARRTSPPTCCTSSRRPPISSTPWIPACASARMATSNVSSRAKPPANEGWWPSYTRVAGIRGEGAVEGGRTQDSNLTRLYGYRERMPVFALAYLHDALIARRGPALRRRIDGTARRSSPPHDERHPARRRQRPRRGTERSVPSLVLELERAVHRDRARHAGQGGVQDAPIRQMVRWMMAVRKNGRWGNTQENAHAMESLVAYYRSTNRA